MFRAASALAIAVLAFSSVVSAGALPLPPCASDIACARPPDAVKVAEPRLGRLPGYADPAERDGATSPMALDSPSASFATSDAAAAATFDTAPRAGDRPD